MTDHDTPVLTLLPLDDRPVNTTQVAALARAAGARLLLPPAEYLPAGGAPGDLDALGAWLMRSARESNAVVVSINQLAFGGFVASRRTGEPLETVLPRLGLLRELRAARPSLPVYAFVTLMRTKKSDGAGAEPPYWAQHGRDLFELSTQMYRAEHGLPAAVDEALEPIPAEHVTDYFTRRLRLHALHLASIELVLAGVVDYLAVTVEDSVVESVSTSEREWLQAWIHRLGLSGQVQCYPGADEAGAVLTARALLHLTGQAPTIAVECIDDDALDRVAPYEDVPARETIAAQAAAAGLRLADDPAGADIILAVHPPGQPDRDWCRWPHVADRPTSEDDAQRLAQQVRDRVRAGKVVTVADVADANGADPALVSALNESGCVPGLGGFAGWNTAGNTIGSAVAQGIVRLLSKGSDQRAEHATIVVHRLLEDWGYQSSARCALLDGTPSAANSTGVTFEAGRVAQVLERRLGELDHLPETFRLDEGSVRFPWDRSFEIDFDLTRRTEGGEQT